jgi:hypothetical protein
LSHFLIEKAVSTFSGNALSERSADMKKLADAAQPLYTGLDEQQKTRFSQALIHVSRDQDD